MKHQRYNLLNQLKKMSSSLEFIEKETPQSQNMYSSLDYPDKMH